MLGGIDNDGNKKTNVNNHHVTPRQSLEHEIDKVSACADAQEIRQLSFLGACQNGQSSCQVGV